MLKMFSTSSFFANAVVKSQQLLSQPLMKILNSISRKILCGSLRIWKLSLTKMLVELVSYKVPRQSSTQKLWTSPSKTFWTAFIMLILRASCRTYMVDKNPLFQPLNISAASLLTRSRNLTWKVLPFLKTPTRLLIAFHHHLQLLCHLSTHGCLS